MRIDIDREKIVVVVQDIVYEYAVGFIKLSLQKIEGANLGLVKKASQSAPVRLQTPPGEGLIIDEFFVGDVVWLQLPHMHSHQISTADQTMARTVRILFWLMIWLAIWQWMPRKTNRNK